MTETFGEALRRLREAGGLSQPRLARLVPISQTTISRYEHNRQAVEHAVAHPSRADQAAVDALTEVLSATRRAEDATSAAAVLPMVRQQLVTVRGVLAEARSTVRPAAAGLASDCEQYLGWLLIATGLRGQAVAHFDAAISLGTEANDPTLVAHGLSFKGYAALLDGQPGTTASLSAASRRDRRVFAPLRAYDAYQETQSLVMEGDRRSAFRTLAEANDLAAKPPRTAPRHRLGCTGTRRRSCRPNTVSCCTASAGTRKRSSC
ncbi:helix-turn-helix transcriptional regulator [Gandjariella thermophila]|uniref:HTH cro/C1-type domain-containing protein n=1 Tax=Gandjariella thermophila TaxID=1931992 RepID=A0A4D4JDR3_9PSEU|nr:helix-turn-helix domain-containing protein [Gandjariella thermophila]GDY33160.1 hypothetical protein GTS_47930 [Gandjariella thermophila]